MQEKNRVRYNYGYAEPVNCFLRHPSQMRLPLSHPLPILSSPKQCTAELTSSLIHSTTHYCTAGRQCFFYTCSLGILKKEETSFSLLILSQPMEDRDGEPCGPKSSLKSIGWVHYLVLLIIYLCNKEKQLLK